MDFFQAIVLAAVQGVSAWIPISSKTQVLLVANALFAIPFQTALSFALLLHLGDLIAALWKYRTEYLSAISLTLSKPHSLVKFDKTSTDEQRFLVIASIATCVLALPLYLLSRTLFATLSGEPLLFAVGIFLLLMAGVTLFTRKKQVAQTTSNFKTAILTGLAQALAVIPGISRSGITQSALLLQGTEPQSAVRLSFLLSAPMIAAAFAAFYFVEGFQGFTIEIILAGIAVSAIVSLLTMDAVTKIARSLPSHYFLAAVGVLAMVPYAIKLFFGISG